MLCPRPGSCKLEGCATESRRHTRRYLTDVWPPVTEADTSVSKHAKRIAFAKHTHTQTHTHTHTHTDTHTHTHTQRERHTHTERETETETEM